MILLLDTSTPICYITIVIGQQQYDYSWKAERALARDLLMHIEDHMSVQGFTALHEIKGIGIMKGPGSFTGLRIGATVANTFARELGIPIVGTTGREWQREALERLHHGESGELVLPDYGRPARITTPKK